MTEEREPVRWITIKGAHLPVYEDGSIGIGQEHEPKVKVMSDLREKVRDRMKKSLTSKYYEPSDREVSREMQRVDEMLEHFEDRDLIEPNPDNEDEVMWRFSGKNSDGDYASFEFGAKDEASAKSSLHQNGYTVNRGMIFPTPIYKYVLNNTNADKQDVNAASLVAKEALKQYRKRK